MLLLFTATATAATAKSLQSCLTLCDPTDGSLPGSLVPGILQARVPQVCLSVGVCMNAHSCLTLCDLLDSSQPGSSAHGILQVRSLEWVAVPSSGASSPPRDQTLMSCISCIGRWVLYR